MKIPRKIVSDPTKIQSIAQTLDICIYAYKKNTNVLALIDQKFKQDVLDFFLIKDNPNYINSITSVELLKYCLLNYSNKFEYINQTQEICNIAFEVNSSYVSKFKKEFITREMILSLINHYKSYIIMTKENITIPEDLYELTISKIPEYISKIPNPSYELLCKAISKYYQALEFIHNGITDEQKEKLYDLALFDYRALRYIPKDRHLTYRVFTAIKNNSMAISFIDSNHINFIELAKIAIDNGADLSDIPQANDEIIFYSLNNNGANINFIENIKPEYVIKAIETYPEAWTSYPDKTLEIESYYVKLFPNIFKYVKNQNREMCLEVVKKNGQFLKYCKHKTKQICLEAIKNYPDSITSCKNENFKLLKVLIDKKLSTIRYSKTYNHIKRNNLKYKTIYKLIGSKDKNKALLAISLFFNI